MNPNGASVEMQRGLRYGAMEASLKILCQTVLKLGVALRTLGAEPFYYILGLFGREAFG